MINPLEHPIILSKPARLTPHSQWHAHIPFAMFLVDILRPRVIVELGTHYGDSYCAFCQAVREKRYDTRCYAIDTWQGDPHSEAYGPEVLADLRAHHDSLYGDFSRLIHSDFDAALEHFSAGSIDILHIDGFHTYDATKHDFETWLPKLSDRAVVLFHDTNVRERDFGVRRLWEELRERYPHFEFLHHHGLGVLAVGETQSPVLQELLHASEEQATRFRNLFFQLGHGLQLQAQVQRMHLTSTQQEVLVGSLQTERDVLRVRLAERDNSIAQFGHHAQRQDELITQLSDNLSERDQLIGQLQQQIQHLSNQLAERNQLVAHFTEHLADRDRTVAALTQHNAELGAMLHHINRARSVRIVRAIRFALNPLTKFPFVRRVRQKTAHQA